MTQINKILLVDDDEITNELNSMFIEELGLVGTIDVATDGLAALEYLRKCRMHGDSLPELIFLDINMPRMGGFEFLEHYAALDVDKEVQQVIIMLSTSSLDADHQRAMADPNVKCFANKPISPEDFVTIVQEFVKARTGEADWASVARLIASHRGGAAGFEGRL